MTLVNASTISYFNRARVSRAVAVSGALRPEPLERQVSALFGIMAQGFESVRSAVEAGKVPASSYSQQVWDAFTAASGFYSSVMKLPVDVPGATGSLVLLGYCLGRMGERMSRDGIIGDAAMRTFVASGGAAYTYARGPGIIRDLLECDPGRINTAYVLQSSKFAMLMARQSLASGFGRAGMVPATGGGLLNW